MTREESRELIRTLFPPAPQAGEEAWLVQTYGTLYDNDDITTLEGDTRVIAEEADALVWAQRTLQRSNAGRSYAIGPDNSTRNIAVTWRAVIQQGRMVETVAFGPDGAAAGKALTFEPTEDEDGRYIIRLVDEHGQVTATP